MRKLLCLLLATALFAGCSSTSSSTASQTVESEATESKTEEVSVSEATPVVEAFAAEYEMVGTTSAGKPKNDTFIFEGETTDGKITTLNFDIIRNKGLDGEYSKKGIMGYLMNISDAAVTKTDDKFGLTFGINGYDDDFGQYMITGTVDDLTADSTFKDLALFNYDGTELNEEQRIRIGQQLANEGDITLTEETPLADLLAIYGLSTDAEGKNRVSFAGYHGGRSYGEQIDAIVDYILANEMTLSEVYEMFRTVNQQSEPINERDTIAGCTIAFVGDFQRMVYLAMTGELFEGVVNTTATDNGTVVEVVTQGFGGEIETKVTFDSDSKITNITIRDAQETADVGALLYAEGSDFLASLIENQNDLGAVDTSCGATYTAKALVKAVQYAVDAVCGK